MFTVEDIEALQTHEGYRASQIYQKKLRNTMKIYKKLPINSNFRYGDRT